MSAAAIGPLLEVEGLTLEFRTRDGRVRALEDVSFSVGKGEILGIVGESGSGKSVTAYAIMGLLEATARITAGSVRFAGIDLLKPGGIDGVRGREIAMIFQSPRTALNPIRKVGAQIEDVLRRHLKAGRGGARAKAVEALAGKASLQDVVEAVTEAELSLQKLTAVRDRVISAYQEIMRMPI